MTIADIQIVRPIPKGRNALPTVAARFGRLALIYVGIALTGVITTFVLCVSGRQQFLTGILGIVLGLFLILGLLHVLTITLTIARITVRDFDTTSRAVLRKIREVGVTSPDTHTLTTRSISERMQTERRRQERRREADELVAPESRAQRKPVRVGWRSSYITFAAILTVWFALEGIHTLQFVMELLPRLSTFAAGLSTGAFTTSGILTALALAAKLAGNWHRKK